MNLFLIRHAAAIEDLNHNIRSDEERYLTASGRITARKFFKHHRNLLSGILHILTSPFLRAVQTAEILSSAIDYEGTIEPADELRADSAVGKAIDLVCSAGNVDSLALVGHEPMMSMLLRATTGGNGTPVGFSKCGTAIIEFFPESKSGRLKKYFDPKTSLA
ncbi:MAG: histidine phosphatase family protein [Ignavibacteria bacterium]|nr:histidine phosphatase family protein [Ignavibacteria bacterium]